MAKAVLRTALCEMVGIDYPIVQTGMGWVATPELTAAVSNAGAIGFLAAASIPPDQVEAAILRVKQLTDKPFGVNFLMDAPGADVISAAIIRQGVKAAGYNRAPSADLIKQLKDGGVVCVPTTGAVKHAVKAEKLGADIIIVQGGEGGGHTGVTPTLLLLAQALDSVDVPVVAAGGFRDGRGLAAALAFGAAGIAMGTRFMMTADSPTPAATKERYLAAQVNDIPVSSRLDGLPQRMVMNETLAKLERSGAIAMTIRALANGWKFRAETDASFVEFVRSAWSMTRETDLTFAQTLMAANSPMIIKKSMVEGLPGEGVLPSGQVAGLIDDLPTCEKLVAGIVDDAREHIRALAPVPQENRNAV